MVKLIMNGKELKNNTEKEKKPKFCINDHIDILIEILKRVDGRSLGVASCVCKLWCAVTRNDSMWEHLCFRHVSSPPPERVRMVVVALGGYKKLYMVCVRPLLNRLLGRRYRTITTGEEQRLFLAAGKVGGGDRGDTGDSSVNNNNNNSEEMVRGVVWTRHHEVELSLSLFCVDYYERVLLGASGESGGGSSGAGGSRLGGDSAALSLMFLCKPVNV